jgi:transposase
VEAVIATAKASGQILFFQQDNAAAHGARLTISNLEDRNIPCIPFPAKSPHLNPIETIWNIMKDWIASNYPDYISTLSTQHEIVQKAWDAVGVDAWYRILETMPQRIRDVIAAEGGHIPW